MVVTHMRYDDDNEEEEKEEVVDEENNVRALCAGSWGGEGNTQGVFRGFFPWESQAPPKELMLADPF